ncbi:MAG: glycosyltransferase family 4 protein [Gammaproteobacteria bacterium]|nr:glycosyltransferase family 4 protein [Gammaproteobacteria bacterium]
MKKTTTPPYNILYCEQNIDGTVGGSYYCLLELTTALDRDIYEPAVIFYTDNFLIPKFRAAGIQTSIFKCSRSVNFTRYFESMPLLSGIATTLLRPAQKALNVIIRVIITGIRYAWYLKKNNIDIVHLNNSILYNHDWMFAARLCGIRCITHERGINTHFPAIARYFARHLDAVISISQAVTNNMAERGVPMDNVITIYDGIDPSRLIINSNPDQVRTKYQINKSDRIIGVVGNVKPWKGQETVVRAMANITKQFPTLRCLIVGATSDNDYVEQLHEIREKLGLTDNIIFTGFQENVADYMNAMDIVIHSSIDPEPFGIVLVEAMALKKPLIATKIGAPLEIVVNGDTGLLVPPNDPDSLAEAVIYILENPDLAQAMVTKAYDRLHDKFILSKNSDQIQAVYHNLLKKE